VSEKEEVRFSVIERKRERDSERETARENVCMPGEGRREYYMTEREREICLCI
jgi:hypothetical protein